MKTPGDDDDNGPGNISGLIAAGLLICASLLILLRMEHYAVRRDCYVQGVHACASVGSGRNPRF
jgi:hypothetical protein